jgi:hypothetical protein
MPETAYLIRGHGLNDAGQNDGTLCKVPEGCLVVVKMQAGQGALFPKWDLFFNCSDHDLNIFLNPIENIAELETKLKSSF